MSIKFETQIWPYVPAKYIGKKRAKTRLVTIHDMEAPELDKTAENVARYFQNPDYPSSAHICVDNNSIVQCVKDSYIAYGAGGGNDDAIHIELAGYGAQKKSDWLDHYSIACLALGADAAAQYCLKYELPPVKLTNQQLLAGKAGIVGHDQITTVYKISTHTDPGPFFPWPRFMAMVRAFYDERNPG
jgi:N-acetyl-anhydromuramyl-L-alanine amidase AmpD